MKLSEKIAVASVISVLIKFIVAGLTLKYGNDTLSFGAVDGLTIAAILTPTLGAVHLETYVGGKKDVDKN